jgi:hypothetical protein
LRPGRSTPKRPSPARSRNPPAFERQRALERIWAAIAVFTFKVAAEESARIYGEYLPLDALDNARRF